MHPRHRAVMTMIRGRNIATNMTPARSLPFMVCYRCFYRVHTATVEISMGIDEARKVARSIYCVRTSPWDYGFAGIVWPIKRLLW